MNPNDAIGYLCLGNLENQFENYSEAELNWKKSIELDEGNKWPYISLGNLYSQLNKYDAAEDIFARAINIFANDYDVLIGYSGLSLSNFRSGTQYMPRPIKNIQFYMLFFT